MARGKRGSEIASVDLGNIAGGPIGETPAEPDSTDGGSAIPGTEQFTDPSSVGTDGSSSGEQPRRGRGRPKGSGNKSRQAETVRSVGAEGVAGILLAIHSTLAVITRTPELELSEDEATKIAKASITVAKLYNIETTEKATAWANLIGVAGAVYVPRFIAWNVGRKMQPPSQSANVSPFPNARPN